MLRSRSASRTRARSAGRCSNCGGSHGPRDLIVNVEPLRPDVPDVGALALCRHRCTSPDASWRRRWQPLDAEHVI